MKLATVLARLSGYLARSSDSASRQLGRLQRLVARHRYPPWRPSLPLTMWVIESLGGRLPTGSCGWALCLMKAVLVLRSCEDRPCSGRVNADGSSCNLAQCVKGLRRLYSVNTSTCPASVFDRRMVGQSDLRLWDSTLPLRFHPRVACPMFL